MNFSNPNFVNMNIIEGLAGEFRGNFSRRSPHLVTLWSFMASTPCRVTSANAKTPSTNTPSIITRTFILIALVHCFCLRLFFIMDNTTQTLFVLIIIVKRFCITFYVGSSEPAVCIMVEMIVYPCCVVLWPSIIIYMILYY